MRLSFKLLNATDNQPTTEHSRKRKGHSLGWVVIYCASITLIVCVFSWVATFGLLPERALASGQSVLVADYSSWSDYEPIDLDVVGLATAAAKGDAPWEIPDAATLMPPATVIQITSQASPLPSLTPTVIVPTRVVALAQATNTLPPTIAVSTATPTSTNPPPPTSPPPTSPPAATNTPVPIATNTPTATETSTATPTNTPTSTNSPTPTDTPTPTSTATPTTPPPAPVRIDAGSGVNYIDSSGNTWLADNGFTGGIIRAVGYPIANTPDQPLYQTERYQMSAFAYAVPNGNYQVNLHFAEIFFTSPCSGQRVFSVVVEGAAINNIDICAEVGPATALVKTVSITVTDGMLNMTFSATANNAEVTGIEIIFTGP